MKHLALALVLLLGACGGEDASKTNSDPAPAGNNGATNNGATNNGTPDPGRRISLSLTEPDDGVLSTTSLVVFRGTVSGTDEVLVAGEPAQVTDGEFVASVILQDGEHTVSVAAGSQVETRTFQVDAHGPRIVLDSPPRGAFVDARREDRIQVRGFVDDPVSDITEVTLDGQRLDLADDGSFEAEVIPKRGVNSLRIEAKDSAGHAASAHRGLIYGEFASPDTPAWNALTFEAGTSLFPIIEEAVLAAINRETIDALILQYGGGVDGLEIRGVEFGEVDIKLEPRAGRLRARIWIHDLRVDLRITQDIMLTDIVLTGSVMADPAEVSTDVYISATPDGSIQASLGNARVTLTDFDIEIEGVLDTLANWLHEWVGVLAEDVLVNVLGAIVVDELFDPELLSRGIEVLGHRIDTSLLLTYLAVDETGISVVADMQTPPENVVVGHDAPGVFTTDHEAPFGRGQGDAQVAFSDEFVNTVLYQFWRGGVLNIDLADLKGEDGVVSEELTAQRFALIAGRELLEHASPDTPVGIEMNHILPPVVAFENGEIRVDMADVLVDLYLDDGNKTRFATVALTLTLFLDIELVDNAPELTFRTTAVADLDDEPLFDMDDETVEATVAALLESLPRIIGSQGLQSFFNLDDVDVLGLYVPTGRVDVGDGYVSFDVDVARR